MPTPTPTCPSTVLVTGGHGLLGGALTRRMADRDDLVTLAPPRQDLDLLDPDQLSRYFDRHDIDAVIHLAADCGGIGYNRALPASIMVNNTRMGLNLFEAAQAHSVGVIVTASSCDAYPAAATLPWREDDLWAGLPEPTSGSYALAKRYLPALGEAYHLQYGIDSTHLIFINMYGERDQFNVDRGYVIPATIAKIHAAARSGTQRVTVWGDGSPQRELLYADDAARVVLRMLDRVNGVSCVNVGSGTVRSITEILTEIAACMDWHGEFVFDPTYPNGHALKVLDTTRMRDIVGADFTFTPFPEAIARTVAASRIPAGPNVTPTPA